MCIKMFKKLLFFEICVINEKGEVLCENEKFICIYGIQDKGMNMKIL